MEKQIDIDKTGLICTENENSCNSEAAYIDFDETLGNKNVFVDLRSDFGFKKVFGAPEALEDLSRLINGILNPATCIDGLEICNAELPGLNAKERKAIFDIYCKNKAFFINTEMQRNRKKNMIWRSFFYISRMVSSSLNPGIDCQFELPNFVGILIADHYVFPEKDDMDCVNLYKVSHQIKCAPLFDKFCYAVVELPRFNKKITELKSDIDVYLYLMRHMGSLTEIPQKLNTERYRELFERARIANFKTDDMKMYDYQKKKEADRWLEVFTAKEDGLEQGREQGREQGMRVSKLESAENLLKTTDLDLQTIAVNLGLSIEDVAAIQERLTQMA